MNRITAISALALVLLTTGICHADSVVITYNSGKTQTVVLDESSVGIKSWQFVGGAASLSPSVKAEGIPVKSKQEPVQKDQAIQTADDKKLTEKAPEKKNRCPC